MLRRSFAPRDGHEIRWKRLKEDTDFGVKNEGDETGEELLVDLSFSRVNLYFPSVSQVLLQEKMVRILASVFFFFFLDIQVLLFVLLQVQ